MNNHFIIVLFQFFDGVKPKVMMYRLIHVTGPKTAEGYKDALMFHFGPERDDILNYVRRNLVALITGKQLSLSQYTYYR